MKVRVGGFVTRHASREVRLYAEQWPLDDRTIEGVTIFPHLCGECVGGDHVHIDTDQEPVYLREGEVELPEEMVATVSSLLQAQLQLNEAAVELRSLTLTG